MDYDNAALSIPFQSEVERWIESAFVDVRQCVLVQGFRLAPHYTVEGMMRAL